MPTQSNPGAAAEQELRNVFQGKRGCTRRDIQLDVTICGALGNIHAESVDISRSGILLRLDPALVAVASQANVGGSTSALALARSLGRGDLALPGILVGALGNALGTYLGFLIATWLS